MTKWGAADEIYNDYEGTVKTAVRQSFLSGPFRFCNIKVNMNA